jgi:hypothetical protein
VDLWASWIIQSNHGTYCCSTHLVIVIGIPNCIFLTNKYQQEYVAHGNKARALQRVITKKVETAEVGARKRTKTPQLSCHG